MLAYQQIGAREGVGAIVSGACNDRRGLLRWVWTGSWSVGYWWAHKTSAVRLGSELPQRSTIPALGPVLNPTLLVYFRQLPCPDCPIPLLHPRSSMACPHQARPTPPAGGEAESQRQWR